MPCLWIGHDAAGDDLGKEAIWWVLAKQSDMRRIAEGAGVVGQKRNELSRPKCKPETRWDEGVRSGCRAEEGWEATQATSQKE